LILGNRPERLPANLKSESFSATRQGRGVSSVRFVFANGLVRASAHASAAADLVGTDVRREGMI
jgi:hypothetical protein